MEQEGGAGQPPHKPSNQQLSVPRRLICATFPQQQQQRLQQQQQQQSASCRHRAKAGSSIRASADCCAKLAKALT